MEKLERGRSFLLTLAARHSSEHKEVNIPGRELIEVTNGPDKADLMRALSDVEGRLRVSFDTPVDSVEANVDALQEIEDDGLKLAQRGHLASGNLRGAVFVGDKFGSCRGGCSAINVTIVQTARAAPRSVETAGPSREQPASARV